MRTICVLTVAAMTAFAVPAFAQSTTNPAHASDSSARRAGTQGIRPTEGRAARQDNTKFGNGNALEGPNHAPDATRNNGQ